MSVVKQHHPDPEAEYSEDSAGLVPPGTKEKAHDISPNQREVHPNPHSQQGKDGDASQKVAAILLTIRVQAAQSAHDHSRKGRKQLGLRKHKHVIGLLVEAQSGSAEPPANEK